MSLHSTREQENDITGNYEHNGWNVKQTVRVVGALIATIVGVSLTQC